MPRRSRTLIADTHTLRILDLTIFALLAFAVLGDPMLDYGRAIGFGWTATLLSILALSVIASAVICFILLHRFSLSWKVGFIYVIAMTGLTIVFDEKLVGYADSEFKMNIETADLKTHYFCVERFSAPRCVDMLDISPSLIRDIPREKRHEIAQKIRVFRGQLERLEQAQRYSVFPQRVPAAAKPPK